MALMNKDYHLITKFDFLYQPSKNNIKYKAVFDNGTYNTFQSYQVGNKYVLITNYMEYKENLEYPEEVTVKMLHVDKKLEVFYMK